MTEPHLVDYAYEALIYNRYMESATLSAIESLNLPIGSRGLDLGCGPGGTIPEFIKAIGPKGHVLGIDLSEAHLKVAAELVNGAKIGSQVTLQQADINNDLSLPDASFDWVWLGDVLWPNNFTQPINLLSGLHRITKPGGVVAIFYGCFPRGLLMPGLDWLERMVYSAALYPIVNKYPHHTHPENARVWLDAAGFKNTSTTIHLAYHCQPLNDSVFQYFHQVIFNEEFQQIVEQNAPHVGLTKENLDLWRKLISPDSEMYLLNQQSYYCLQYGVLSIGHTE